MTVNAGQQTLLLKGGHVLDPAQGIDGVMDVAIRDGKLLGVGVPVDANATAIDVSGHYVTPGWIDIHVHLYGNLGFADPDSIGVFQGVTSYVDAGGPGIGTIDEFVAMYQGRTVTDLYAGAYIRPIGLIGVNHLEGNVRALNDIPIAKWLDFIAAHPGLLKYLKIAALGSYGTGPLKLGKGLAEILGLPLYTHIGEFQNQPRRESVYEIYRICGAGDIITHAYHGNVCGILDEKGRVLPVVREAANRGVLFDIGFGGYNFSWSVAEKAVEQEFLPHIISSDLQQFNVVGPAFSLANVMTIFMRLGMSLPEVIARVTRNPAEAISISHRAGSLKSGYPADVTVFRIDHGDVDLKDTYSGVRHYDRRVVPVMTFKNGEQIMCDLLKCQDDRNWLIQIAEDHVPLTAERLTAAQRRFLEKLADGLADVTWNLRQGERFDLDEALALHQTFHAIRAQSALSLREALTAVFDSFLESPFAVQMGLFLLRMEKPFVLGRLREVSQRLETVA